MKTRQKLLSSTMFLACGVLSLQTQAALPVDPVLNFAPGILTCNPGSLPAPCSSSQIPVVLSGSYFGMDTTGNGIIAASERTAISMTNGLRIGTSSDAIQAASGTHGGAPNGSESPNIDAAWNFFGNTGLHYTNVAASIISTTSNTAILNFSGWGVTWNGIPAINMGSGAWGTNGFVSGQAQLVCAVDCAIGDTFTLDYRATVPVGDPSNFGGVLYNLHLVGTIGGFNTAPVTTAFSIGVLSTTAAPTPGVAGPISLTGHVTDTQDILTNDNVFTGSTPIISSPSSNIATNCTPTAVTANANGTVTFPACTNGTYTFDFSFSDAYETSNISTVTVTASGDPVPNAAADTATANGVTPVVISVLTNDTDNNLDTASIAIVSNGAHGTATVVDGSTDTISYTANAGYSGTDTFTYTVDDLALQTSNIATVTITVSAMNTPASSATFAVGSIASAAGSTTGIVTLAQIGVPDTGTFPEDDIAQSCIGGCFDFTLSGIANGGTTSVVLPLSTAIPAKADSDNSITYRKLINGTWRNFYFEIPVVTYTDNFKSAPGTVTGSDVVCPPADDTSYTGLTTGHRCLLLTMTDGGPNDADGLANGSIADPGGLAEITRVVGTDGCSMTGRSESAADHADWLLLAGFMGMLGWFGMKRRQA